MGLRLLSVCLIILLDFCSDNTLYGQLKFTKVTTGSLPADIKYKGEIVSAVKWVDSLGTNYSIVSKYETPADTADRESNTVYFYHYIPNGNGYRLIWRYFTVHECSYPIQFIDKELRLTDLDNNGRAEIWYVFKWLFLQLDQQQSKVIMNEVNEMYIVESKDEQNGDVGNEKYIFEYNFKDGAGNPLFRNFAVDLWRKYEGL